jgi:hypothetical protein
VAAAVDPATGDVYLAEQGNAGVEKYSPAGSLLLRFTGAGSPGGPLQGPFAVGVDPATGDVYVSDQGAGSPPSSPDVVKRFSSRGGFVSQLSVGSPLGLAVDPAGDLDVASGAPSATLQRFTAAGAPLAPIAGVGLPAGVGLDPSSGTVWVADVTGTVRGFDSAGALVAEFDGSTAPSGAFSRPVGVAVDGPSHDVYVSDLVRRVVNRFTSTGGFVSALQGAFEVPGMPGVDPVTGAVYLPDVAGRVVVFGLGPAIGGTPADGATVYASGPTQVGRGPFGYSYQWLLCPVGGGACSNRGGPSSSSGVRLTPADEGQRLEVRVTVTSPSGTIGPVTSQPVGPVAPAPPVNQVAPAISGAPSDGAVLTATHGTWSGALVMSYAYTWHSCTGGTCVPVSTAAAYRLAPTDVGHTIEVGVSATNPDGTAGPVTSSPVGPVTPSPPVDQTPPSITGAFGPGSRLQGHAGTWGGVLPISYAYQWQRCPDRTTVTCVDIPGATLNNYRLTAADVHVRMVVTATNADGTASAASPLAP